LVIIQSGFVGIPGLGCLPSFPEIFPFLSLVFTTLVVKCQEIDQFIKTYLMQKASGTLGAPSTDEEV